MQLMLLEKQNKKRLDIARLNGTIDNPPQQMLPAMQMNNQMQMRNSPVSSPHPNNKPSPVANSAKVKKEPAKRGRKSSVTMNNMGTPLSNGSDNNGSNGRAANKKENTTPPTPITELEPGKKKRKAESPKKAKPAPAKKAMAKPKKSDDRAEEDEDKNLDIGPSAMGPPDSLYPPSMGEKILSSGILGSGGSHEANFFNSGGNSSIDDIDFDFNLFLEGGDGGLNDGITGLGWGNPIEGD